MKIVILDGYTVTRDDLNWADFLSLGELHYFPRSKKEEVIPRIGDADVVLTNKCIIDKNVIDSCPNLKYIGVLATGYNNIDIEYAKSKGIVIANAPSYSTNSVAQLTFALLLEAVNAVGKHSDATRAGEWQKSIDFCFSVSPQISLEGKTFGIIGYGSIGKKVAKIAQAFSMKVIVYTPHPPKENKRTIEESSIEFVELDDLCSKADIISLHCPLNEDTKGIINRDRLAKMVDGVIIINTARGPLIDEYYLAVALQTNKVKYAALDVLGTEPPTTDNKLTDIENCIITPHIAWMADVSRETLIKITFINLEAFSRGETPITPV